MEKTLGSHLPVWSDFVYSADRDLLSFAVLQYKGLFAPAVYHGTQAVEKYLKALALSMENSDDLSHSSEENSWIESHDFVDLAKRCAKINPYYNQEIVKDMMQRLNEYDQISRYGYAKGDDDRFSSNDIVILEDIIFNLRNDIPIQEDDYPLGLYVRGHYYNKPNFLVNDPALKLEMESVKELSIIFKNVNSLVRR